MRPSAAEPRTDREGLAIDQAVADSDRGAAGVDQAVSDVDQAASERDDADATRDQRSADRDQASADALHADAASEGKPGDDALDEAYRATRAERTATRIGRLKSHTSRAGTADARLDASRGRDRSAARRDVAADRRDLRAIELEAQIATVERPVREQFEHWRKRAVADRAQAAADRRRAATERTEAAIELAQLRTALHHAYLDELTGAFGRAMGNHVMELEIDRSRRDGGRLVLAFVDVDGLKAINDRAGHPAGDIVLRTLVSTMRSSLRSFDPIVRYGGDEFVCAVAGVDAVEVDDRFSDIRDSLYADTGASISIGLATLAEGETLEQLIARADAALLGAKRARPD